jgi:hypothetical protein
LQNINKLTINLLKIQYNEENVIQNELFNSFREFVKEDKFCIYKMKDLIIWPEINIIYFEG